MGALSDLLEGRTGVDLHKDKRLREAAHPAFNRGACQLPPATRRRGRPTKSQFMRCACATTDLVHELQGNPTRHDWETITAAMIWPGGWGPLGVHGVPFAGCPRGWSDRRVLEDLRDRIKDAWYRDRKRRRRAGRIKPRRKRIKLTFRSSRSAIATNYLGRKAQGDRWVGSLVACVA
jgi:hypothetical protein